MTEEVYIGNLDFQTTEEQVRRLCAPFGRVQGVTMITDRQSGRFRGFCFVKMDTEAAKALIAGLNGKEVAGRKVRVSPARRQNQKRRDKKESAKTDQRPLHERTARGGFGPHDFPDSGGGSRRQQRNDRSSRQGNSDFPHSGGGSRRGS